MSVKIKGKQNLIISTITMLKSYEAIYENGQFKWLKDKPQITSARVIVTILEESSTHNSTHNLRRTPPKSIAGKGKTLGDIVNPIVEEDEWECLK